MCLLHSENSIHSKEAAYGPVMVSTRHLSHQDRSKSAPRKKTDSLSEGGENKTAVKKRMRTSVFKSGGVFYNATQNATTVTVAGEAAVTELTFWLVMLKPTPHFTTELSSGNEISPST